MKYYECFVGDRVVVKNNSLKLFGIEAGMIGTIDHILPDWTAPNPIGLVLDNKFRQIGFDLGGKCDIGHGIYVKPGHIKLCDEEDDGGAFQEELMSIIGVAI